jgi:hypothetical protein
VKVENRLIPFENSVFKTVLIVRHVPKIPFVPHVPFSMEAEISNAISTLKEGNIAER